jgi:rubredoxin
VGRRWDRFRHWLWYGADEVPVRWTCPKCHGLVPLGPPPIYNGRGGAIVIPWTNKEIIAACPACHPDKATQVETTGSD